MNAYLLSGSNLGNRTDSLSTAKKLVAATGSVLRASSVYETAAWGVKNQPAYLNQALEVKTDLSPEKLLSALKHIEKTMGRKQARKWGPRVIDLDILLVDNCILKTAQLTIPHPQLPLRRFALLPLTEIAPGLVHPELGLTVQELLLRCPDTLAAQKFIPENTSA